MANFLYNGIELPELPAELNGKPSFIFYDSGYDIYRLRCFPDDAHFRIKSSTSKIMISLTRSGWEYYTGVVTDGAWEITGPLICNGSTMEFVNVIKVIWTSMDIIHSNGSGVYLAASDPVPVTGSTLKPVSMLQGWFMGRKIAQTRQQ